MSVLTLMLGWGVVEMRKCYYSSITWERHSQVTMLLSLSPSILIDLRQQQPPTKTSQLLFSCIMGDREKRSKMCCKISSHLFFRLFQRKEKEIINCVKSTAPALPPRPCRRIQTLWYSIHSHRSLSPTCNLRASSMYISATEQQRQYPRPQPQVA
jgi:hypothetical protein